MMRSINRMVIRKTELLLSVLCILLATVLFMQSYRLKDAHKRLQTARTSHSAYTSYFSNFDRILGNELLSMSVYNIQKNKKAYRIIVVVGKLNCNSCVSEIRELLMNLSQQEMHVFTVLYTTSDESLERFKEKFAWDFPIISGDLTEWYEEHDLIVGPSIFLVDGKTGKVLNCLINASDDVGGRKRAFYDFLERMFGKSGE